MVRNLNDSPLERMNDAQQHARRENPLERSSVRDGQVRFIRGTLRVDDGGNVVINGTLEVNGTSTVTGEFTVSGPWSLTGDGDITGNVDLTGTVTVTGDIEVTGAGKIKVGNVILEDGKIKAGGMTIDPNTGGGQIDFGGGRVINAGSGFLGIYDGGRFVVFNSSGITMNAGGRSVSVGDGGIRFAGTPTKTASETGLEPGSAFFDSSDYIYKVVPG